MKKYIIFILSFFALSYLYAQSFNELKEKADRGDAEAVFHLGYYYLYGVDTDRDPAQALFYLQQAADAKNNFAMYRLAKAYYYGEAGMQNKAKAIELWKKSINRISCSSYEYALCLLRGDISSDKDSTVSKKEINTAFKQILMSAQLYCYDAAFMTGVMLMEGQFFKKDKKAGMNFLNISRDYLPSQAYIARLYHEGINVKKNDLMANYFIRQAVGMEDTSALQTLALWYYNGEIVDMDVDMAKTLLKRNIALGDETSVQILKDIENELLSNVNSIRVDAVKGDMNAQERFGLMYYKGWGVRKDTATAIQQWRNAYAQGSKKAALWLAEMYANGEIDGRKDTLKAISLIDSLS